MEIINQKLQELSKTINPDKSVSRLHNNSRFNKSFLLLRSSFEDLRVFWERVDNESKEVQKIEDCIMLDLKENKNGLEEGDRLRLRLHELVYLLNADVKAIYIFSKIFIIRYIELMVIIIGEDGIGTRGFSRFLTSMERIKDKPVENPLWSKFAHDFLSKLRILECRIFFYRDKFIEHHQIYDSHNILSMFGIPSGSFILHSISLEVPEKTLRKARQIIKKIEVLAFLKGEKDNRKIAEGIFNLLPDLPEGSDKEDLKIFVKSAGIPSLSHQELLNMIKDFIINSSDFIIKAWPEIKEK